MRIAHVPLNVANVAWRLAEAQNWLGHYAVVFSRPTPPYNFPVHVPLQPHTDPLRWNLMMLRLRETLEMFDVVHVHGGISRSQFAYRLLKKPKIFIHYHGRETRMGVGLHHQNLANGLFYTPPDLRERLPETAIWVPQPAPQVGQIELVPGLARPVFAHFSTSEQNKGTEQVIEMFHRAFAGCQEFQFDGHGFHVTNEAELHVFRSLTPERVLHEMRFMDVVFDQIAPFGIYGAVAVEAMALGLPVLATVNRALYPSDCPVIWPRVTKLMELARDADGRKHYGRLGREYAERIHDPLKVAQKVLDAYETATNP